MSTLFFVLGFSTACQMSGQREAGTHTYLSVPVEEYADEQIAYHVLAKSSCFTTGIVLGEPEGSLHWMAFRTLLRSDKRVDLFSDLIEEGTISGQLYALAGLYLCDHIAYEKWLPEYRDREDLIVTLSGDQNWDMPVGELVLSTSEDAKHPAIGQTFSEWREDWNESGDWFGKDARLDIAGGGFSYYFSGQNWTR